MGRKKKSIKIWMDDLKTAPKGFFRCYSINEAKRVIEECENRKIKITVIDCDHDMGVSTEDGGDGILLLDWILERETQYPIKVHMMKPIGRISVQRILKRFRISKRIIVSGGRDFIDYPLLKKTLDDCLDKNENVEFVTGHARGADLLGEHYAAKNYIPCKLFPADWKTHGRQGRFIRNKEMLDYAMEKSAMLIAFWDGRSHGIQDMIDKARTAGVKCIVVNYAKDAGIV